MTHRNSKRAPQRSRGAVLLARTGETQAAIAAKTGLHRSVISFYMTGKRRPTRAEDRARFRDAYRIPLEAWDAPGDGHGASVTVSSAPPSTGRHKAVKPSPSAVESPATTPTWDAEMRAQVARLSSIVNGLLREAEQPGTTPLERSRIAQKAAQTMEAIGRLTGSGRYIDERRLVRLPVVRRVFETMVETLKPWPDAMRAVGVALEKLDGGSP